MPTEDDRPEDDARPPQVRLDPREDDEDEPAPPRREARPDRPRHPAYLVNIAKTLGLRDEQIAAHSTESLGHVVETIQARDHANQSAYDRAAERRPVPTLAPDPPPEEFDFGEIEENGRRRRVTADDLDPLGAHIVKSLVRQNRELTRRLEGQEREGLSSRIEDTLDEAFEILGERFGHYFGVGAGAELTDQRKDREFDRRIRAVKAAGIDFSRRPSPRVVARKIAEYMADLQAASAPPPKPGKPDTGAGAYSAAVEDDYPDPPPPRRRQPRATNGQYLPPEDEPITPERWDAAALAAPTNRRPRDEPKGDAKARRSVEEKLRQFRAENPDQDLDQNGRFQP